MSANTKLWYFLPVPAMQRLKLLLVLIADVNTKDEKGESPLQLAIRIGHKETADLFRKHGAKE